MLLHATLVFVITLSILLIIARAIDHFGRVSPQFKILAQYFEYALIGVGGLGLLFWIGRSLAALVQ